MGLFHQIAELGAEDLGERLDGEKKVDSGRLDRIAQCQAELSAAQRLT
jgi:hypothetical protein